MKVDAFFKLLLIGVLHPSIALFMAMMGDMVKLPILQVIGMPKEGLKTEFMCGNDLDSETPLPLLKAKLSAGLEPFLSISECPPDKWQEVYSDDHLQAALKSPANTETTTILLLYRQACGKCTQVDSILPEIFARGTKERVQLVRANVDYTPDYLSSTLVRLKGADTPSGGGIENCEHCGNTGFVKCDECQGTGMATRGTSTVICPTCTGYRKQRCPICGGQCLMC